MIRSRREEEKEWFIQGKDRRRSRSLCQSTMQSDVQVCLFTYSNNIIILTSKLPNWGRLHQSPLIPCPLNLSSPVVPLRRLSNCRNRYTQWGKNSISCNCICLFRTGKREGREEIGKEMCGVWGDIRQTCTDWHWFHLLVSKENVWMTSDTTQHTDLSALRIRPVS